MSVKLLARSLAPLVALKDGRPGPQVQPHDHCCIALGKLLTLSELHFHCLQEGMMKEPISLDKVVHRA